MGEMPWLPLISGYLATVCFTFQYIPQIILNYKRKSVSGFSTSGIIIKLVGASFLAINAHLTGEAIPVVLYGLLNIAQHSIFMFQFATYTQKRQFYIWILFPIVPILMGRYLPSTMTITNSAKPLSQIFSHLPQLYLTYEKKSTMGVSMLSQHLNFAGGILGILMYLGIPPVSKYTYLVYINSLFQATSMYVFAVYFDGFGRLFTSDNAMAKIFDEDKEEMIAVVDEITI
jgi:uncharacterized protein with PQ loop repeat